jgi:hypothetical protein
MKEKASPEIPARHPLFEAALRQASWTVEQLWIDYLALGGALVVFDLEAYLAGLIPISPEQQDVLACALNERLADLHLTMRVAYLTAPTDHWPDEDALKVLLQDLRDPSSSD